MSTAKHFLAFPKTVYLCVTDAKNIAGFQFFSVIEEQMFPPSLYCTYTFNSGSLHTNKYSKWLNSVSSALPS